jgi:hypothetical protein
MPLPLIGKPAIDTAMKKIITILCLLGCPGLSFRISAQNDTTLSSVVSKAGTPDGTKTVIKISKDGGRLKSADGTLELIVPEGAVSKKTNISIQPITNLMSNGNGKAYRLEPSGIHFSRPIQIIFHYKREDQQDIMQMLLGIAMQSEDGAWKGLKKFQVDTIARTISGEISHFSDWSSFSSIKINPEYARVKVSNTKPLEVTGVLPDPADTGDDELVQLVKSPRRVTWKVNNITGGNAKVGTVNGRMLGAYYSAPSVVPDQNPVAVSAELQGLNLKFDGKSFNDLRLVSNILVYDNAYEVTLISSNQGHAGSQFGQSKYHDMGSFVVSLESGKAKLIEKMNRNQSDEIGYQGKCTIVLLKAGTGNIHITGVKSIKVIPPKSPQEKAWIEISFVKAPARLSLLQATCPPVGKGGPTTTTTAAANAMMASLVAALPHDIRFEAKEGEQTLVQVGQEGAEIFLKITVKQLKD